MILEALRYLVGLGKEQLVVHLLEQGADADRVLVAYPDGTHEVVNVRKELRASQHVLSSVDSFLRYVRNYPGAQVFVGKDGVDAVLNPDSNRGDRVAMALDWAPQFGALKMLWTPQRQQYWMQSLRGLLKDCLSPDLTLQMSQLEVGRRGVRSVKVDDIGTETRRGEVAVAVTTNDGTNSVPLKTLWRYTGPLWRCVPDLGVEVDLVLQAKEDEDTQSLRFFFTPLDLEREVDRASDELIGLLERGLNPDPAAGRIEVFAGRPQFVFVG